VRGAVETQSRRPKVKEAEVEISCALPTTLDSPEQVVLAEELGYERAWLYDTPQQSPDVWMTLALAAQRTERIGLGPGVLVPTLRHPMVNAAATAALAALAPGRVGVAFGTGFSGRRAMGYRAIPWSFMDAYIRAYRGLLRGDTVEWEGVRMRMLHPPGHAAPRPVDVPVIIAALGPKGAAVARELGDGLYITLALPEFAKEFSRVSYLFWGTVLDDGEDPDSERVRAAGGPGWALAYHGAYEFGTPLEELPGGREWDAVVQRTAKEERHFAVHEQHCVGLNEADQAAWDAGGHGMLKEVTMSGTRNEVRDRLGALADQGVTEIVFQPCGPDTRRELEVFMDTAKAAVAA
jgi:5,10-methylenetetrahydromethanopterin reductase